MSKKKTYEEVLNDFIKVHGDEYDYSLLKDFFEHHLYHDTKTKLPIICKKHGLFEQDYSKHYTRGHGCPKCAKSGVKYTIKEYKEKIEGIFGGDIVVLSDEYVNAHTPLKFLCKKHGEFETKPYYLLQGHTCPECGKEISLSKIKFTKEEILNRFYGKHGDEYDYSEFEYIGYNIPSVFICHKKNKKGKEHGKFLQTPHSHINGHGCPICNASKLEKEIMRFFDDEGIDYEFQKMYDWLVLQRLDFYLPQYNIAIECQGEQHYMPSNFGSKKQTPEQMFEYVKRCDKKKEELCKEHAISILYYTKHKYKDNITFNDKHDLLKYIKENYEQQRNV